MKRLEEVIIRLAGLERKASIVISMPKCPEKDEEARLIKVERRELLKALKEALPCLRRI